MKKILFIASLNTKKEKYDGERIKSTFMHLIFKGVFIESIINLSKHKIFNTFKIMFVSCFLKKRYDHVIISKDPHGANIILKIMRFFHFPLNKIIYFEIGPFLYDRIINGTIKKKTFEDIKIIVETNSMSDELKTIGISTYDVFPNFKPIYKIEPFNQHYPKKILEIIFFSRIEEMKGIYDLIEAIQTINSTETKYVLSIFGRPSSIDDERKVIEYTKKYNYIKYGGQISLDSIEGYKQLSKYDLHIFPTKYSEGFPGSLIDFFIAGVPTLSSTFARAYDILTPKIAFFYSQGNVDDLISKLNYIFSHQDELNKMRLLNHLEKDKYSTDTFKEYVLNLVERISNE